MQKILLIVWFLAYKVAWLACVLGGGVYGYPLLAAIPMLIWVVIWIAVQQNKRSLLYTCIFALLYGAMMDSVLVLLGTMRFAPHAETGTPSPLWMMMLWLGFGAIYEKSLGVLKNKKYVLPIIGAIGGPMAYIGGANMGAVEIGRSETEFIILIGIEWALALPLLMWCTLRYSQDK